jgi:hypothetical protein
LVKETQGILGVKKVPLTCIQLPSSELGMEQEENITFFKGGPTDPSLQKKEHPTASKIHAMLDSCPF